MPINHLYDTWKRRILELRPNQRITQVENMDWMIVGIYQSRSVYLSRIAAPDAEAGGVNCNIGEIYRHDLCSNNYLN